MRTWLIALVLLAFLAGWFGHSLFGPGAEPRPDANREGPAPLDDRLPATVPGLEAAPPRPPEPPKNAPAAPAEPAVAGASTQTAPRSGDAAHGTLRVRVREFSGNAVPGITVRVFRPEPTPVSKDAATDADGAAELSGLDPGEWQVQALFSEGSQISNVSVHAGHLTEVVLVHPARGVRFEGTVRDVTKGPVEGVVVTLSTMEGGYVTLKAQTNANGFYRFEGVRPGGWNVSLSSNASTSGFSQSNRVFVPPDETFRKDFLAGPLLRGTVRDRDTGEPIAGVNVQSQRRGQYLDMVTTDAEGAFGFKGLNPGRLDLTLLRSGYGLTILRDIEVPAEGAAVNLEMSPAARLRLHLTDAKGRAVTGDVFIGVTPKVEGQGTPVGMSFQADAEGRATYDQILPGSYVLRFVAKGIGEAQVEANLILGENALEVRMEAK